MKKIFFILALLISFSSVFPQNYYAVIIAGKELNDDPVPSGENSFWNDSFLMWEFLSNRGVSEDHIYFLYGNGEDIKANFDEYSARYTHPFYNQNMRVTDYPANKSNVENIFNWMANGNNQNVPQLTENDVLIVYVYTHGSGDINCNSDFQLNDYYMTDTELASLINPISYKKRILIFNSCYSGGFIDNFSGLGSVVITSTTCNTNATYADNVNPDATDSLENEIEYGETYYHGEFNYHFLNAIRDTTVYYFNTPVLDQNGVVSVKEAFDWGVNRHSGSRSPQISGGAIDTSTYLDPQLDKLWQNTLVVQNKNSNPYLIWGPYDQGYVTSYKVYRAVTSYEWQTPVYSLLETVSSSTYSYTDDDFAIGGQFILRYRVTAMCMPVDDGPNYESGATNTIRVTGGIYKEGNITPVISDYEISQNYPNPFNPSTIIEYTTPEVSHVVIKVYDILGREVTELVNGVQDPGKHQVLFDAKHLSNGVYIYSITAKNNETILFRQSKQMILMK